MKTTRDLTTYLLLKNPTLRKDIRYTLGERLIDCCLDITVEIVDANSSLDQERIKHIDKIIRSVNKLRNLVRICAETKQYSFKTMADIIEKVESIEKQARGWKNSIITKPQGLMTRKDTKIDSPLQGEAADKKSGCSTGVRMP